MSFVKSAENGFVITVNSRADRMHLNICIYQRPFWEQDFETFALFSSEILVEMWGKMSHVMRKPILAICEQQRCRSAWASAGITFICDSVSNENDVAVS